MRPTGKWKRRLTWVFGIIFAIIFIVPAGFVVWLRSGPTAPVPTESPWDALNREFGGDEDNAWPLIVEARASLTRDAPEVDERMQENPPEINAWLDENERALQLLHEASLQSKLWAPLKHAQDGTPELFAFPELRDLRKLIHWHTWRAVDDCDPDRLAKILLMRDRIRRLLEVHPLLQSRLRAMTIVGCDMFQVIAPMVMSGLTPEDRAGYVRKIEPLFDPPPPIGRTLDIEVPFCTWMYITASQKASTARDLLVPPARVAGELALTMASYKELDSMALHEQLDIDAPLRQTIRERQIPPPMIRLAESAAHLLAFDMLLAFDLRGRWIAQQRGMRTTLELFLYRDTHGAFPNRLQDLDGIDPEFIIDPFSGRPFAYRRDGDSFTLYSLGHDNDDDGGQHDERAGWGRGSKEHPDGDFVFWPPESP